MLSCLLPHVYNCIPILAMDHRGQTCVSTQCTLYDNVWKDAKRGHETGGAQKVLSSVRLKLKFACLIISQKSKKMAGANHLCHFLCSTTFNDVRSTNPLLPEHRWPHPNSTHPHGTLFWDHGVQIAYSPVPGPLQS